jgi:uncharacterized protein YdeI (YjbR/CyaY-like superfamily)
MNEVPHFYAANIKSWREWLKLNHQKEQSVWLVYDKGKQRAMSWQDVVQEALCYGWIDSRPGKVSETQSKIYVSKRKPKSVWSKINKDNVEILIREGRIQTAGLKSVEVAKKNGSWNALNLSDNLVIPRELSIMFKLDSAAESNFKNYPIGSKKNTLQWIYDAKTPKTKQDRAEKVFLAAKENRRLR